MKTVKTYQNISDALLGQSWLGSNGIESFIPDEVSASSALPHLSVYSGIRLQVIESDYEAALKLLDDEPSQPKTEDKKVEFPEAFSPGDFKAIVGVDLALYVLSTFLTFIHMSLTPESILRYAADQYISYPMASLAYALFWPYIAIRIVAFFGLLFMKKWARLLYITMWVIVALYQLFASGYFIYPIEAFIGGLSALSGGFICCMIYFTNASLFFEREGANQSR